MNNNSIIYTVGYQPIELIDRSYKIVDLINLVTDSDNLTTNILTAVLEYLKNIKLNKNDYYFLNTKKNMFIIPYLWESLNNSDELQNLIIYDPPYVASSKDISTMFDSISSIIGPKTGYRSYIDAVNSVRESLVHVKDNMSQSDYFNSLMLLSDLNSSNVDEFIKYLLAYKNPYQMRVDKKVIFFGDPITPKYFNYLNSMNIFVVSFLPYEFFLNPCNVPSQYYFENPFFQSHLFMLVELKRLITVYMPDALILNPGNIYLTQQDVNFFIDKLKNYVKIIVLSGNYPGEQISL